MIDGITYPFSNFSGCVWEWILNFTTHSTEHVITDPRWDGSSSMLIKEASVVIECLYRMHGFHGRYIAPGTILELQIRNIQMCVFKIKIQSFSPVMAYLMCLIFILLNEHTSPQCKYKEYDILRSACFRIWLDTYVLTFNPNSCIVVGWRFCRYLYIATR